VPQPPDVPLDTGNTAFVLLCTALVLLMTPGLAIFYAGMVRAKSSLAMLMQVFTCIGVVSVTWVLLGYSLAFGEDVGAGLLGDLRFAGGRDLDAAVPGLDLSVPPVLFATFQMMFAVLTVALIAGAIADRVRFGAFVGFATLWSVLVYAPLAHWVFSPSGWMARFGVLDFAGGLVVEVNCGAAGLADVVGVHFVGGVVGMLFLGLLASAAVNPVVADEGLLLGGGLTQLGRQAVGVLAATAFSFTTSWVIAKAVDRVLPWRVSEDEEQAGLDQALHAETAYDFGSVRTMGRR